MSFAAVASMLVTICMLDHSKPCRTDELARFGMEEAGQTYCTGLAMELNELTKNLKDGTEQHYYCMPPEAAADITTEP